MGYNGCMFVFCADGPPSPFPAADDVHSVWHQPVGQHVPCLWIKHIKPSTVLAYELWKNPSKGMIHARWRHMTPFYDLLWLFVQFGWFMALCLTNVYHMASIYQLCWCSIGCQDFDQRQFLMGTNNSKGSGVFELEWLSSTKHRGEKSGFLFRCGMSRYGRGWPRQVIIDIIGRESTKWVCLKIGYTPTPNGFAEHYPL